MKWAGNGALGVREVL